MKRTKRWIAGLLSWCVLLSSAAAYADSLPESEQTESEVVQQMETAAVVEENDETEVKETETCSLGESDAVMPEETEEETETELVDLLAGETEVAGEAPELFSIAEGAIPVTAELLNQLWRYKQSIEPHCWWTITLNGMTSGPMCNTACGQCTYMAAHYALTGEHLDFMSFVTESFGTGFYTGINSSYEYVANDAYPTKAWYENKYKVTGHHVDNNWDSVTAELKQGHPIVFWVQAPNHFQMATDPAAIHYILALSYSEEADRIFIWNPNRYEPGQGWFTRDEFNTYVVPQCTQDNNLNKLPWAMERIVDRAACEKHTVDNLMANAASEGVKLTWTDTKDVPCDGYEIYGYNSNGAYHRMGATTETFYVDKEASAEKENSYWVVPYVIISKEVVRGKFMGPVTGYPKMTEALIKTLGAENLKALSTKEGVKLTWKRIGGVTGYAVYGKTKGGQYIYIGATAADSYLHTKASTDEYTFYWVFPYYKTAEGKVLTGKTVPYVYGKSLAQALTPVEGLRGNSEKGGARLMWQAVEGAEGYLLYGKTAKGTYAFRGMTSGTTFKDAKASAEEWTFYWVFPYKTDMYGKKITAGTKGYVYAKTLK